MKCSITIGNELQNGVYVDVNRKCEGEAVGVVRMHDDQFDAFFRGPFEDGFWGYVNWPIVLCAEHFEPYKHPNFLKTHDVVTFGTTISISK